MNRVYWHILAVTTLSLSLLLCGCKADDTEVNTLLSRGRQAYRGRQLRDSLRAAQEVLRRSPDELEAGLLAVKSTFYLERYREARRHARQGQKHHPGYYMFHYWEGRALEAEKQPAKARKAYHRGLQLSPGHKPTQLRLARLLTREGKMEAALAVYRLHRHEISHLVTLERDLHRLFQKMDLPRQGKQAARNIQLYSRIRENNDTFQEKLHD